MRFQKYYCSIIISCICRLNSEDDVLISLLSHYAKANAPVCCVVHVQSGPTYSYFSQKKLPELNFCTLTVYMYIPVAAHVHFPVNLHTEKFPSGDAAEVFLCIQQDVNGLGSAIK